MLFSLQVSVSEVANTNGLLEGQNSVVMPKFHACFFESFDCRSRSIRPCAANVQNNVFWMVGKSQWSCHHS